MGLVYCVVGGATASEGGPSAWVSLPLMREIWKKLLASGLALTQAWLAVAICGANHWMEDSLFLSVALLYK